MANKDRCAYLIRNSVNGKVYVGSSIAMRKRWLAHRRQLRGGRHQNDHLSAAWKKHGETSFEFSVVEECEQDDLIAREAAWVEHYGSMDASNGYNLEHPDRHQGHTEATKQKIAKAHRESPACRGHRHSAEFKRRMSELHKGNQYNKGRVQSPDEKAKRSRSAMGKNKGRKLSEEHKRELSEAHKGFVPSVEHRANLSAAMRRVWAQRKKEQQENST